MRILHRPGTRTSGTQFHSQAVAERLFPALSAPAAARLRRFFRVEMTRVDHNDIPVRFGRPLLENAAADLPGTVLFTGAARPTREAELESRENESSESSESSESNEGLDETLAWLDVEATEAEGEG